MKKYLKSQAKKSMSLFLAVLMLLSCWVWVAPEKAEAGTSNSFETTYTVIVGYEVKDYAASGGSLVYKTLGDGWATTETEHTYSGSVGKSVGKHELKFTTTNFLTNIKLNINGKDTSSKGKTRTEMQFIKINGKTVYSGGSTPEGWNGNATCNIYPTYDDGGKYGTTGKTNDNGGCNGIFSWPRPMIVGFYNGSTEAATPGITVKLNRVNGLEAKGTSDTTFDISKYTCYNQYGVAMTYNASKVADITKQETYVADNSGSSDESQYKDYFTVTSDNNNVSIKPALQTLKTPNADGVAEFYLVRKYLMKTGLDTEEESKATAKITVKYPTYTVNFKTGLSTSKITVGTDEYTGSYSPSNYYGKTISVPSKTEASGYTFYDYWSNEQKSYGAASYNSAAADFAKPCSTEDYNAYVKAAGSETITYTGTVDGKTDSYDVVKTADGGIYYDAGVKFDPSTNKTIDTTYYRENWYGWWLSKDLTVKFYDVDGAFLGEELAKAGQKYNAITWPTSKYVIKEQDGSYKNGTYTSGAFKYNVDANIWVDTDGTQMNKTSTSATFSKDIMILTPLITRAEFDNAYTINFVHPNNGDPLEGSGNKTYRQDVKADATTAYNKLPAVPGEIAKDLQYSYELIGWSSVVPTTGKNYHVVLEDADFDVNGTAIGANKDWTVRDDATYYAIYRRATKTYVVEFFYADATGTIVSRKIKVKYGDNLVAPTDYVPYTYVTGGFGYTFEQWLVSARAPFKYDDKVAFTLDNFKFDEKALDDGDAVEPVKVEADYLDPVPTPYTVTFNYVDTNNDEVSSSVEVKNEQFILQNTIAGIIPAEEWENEDQLYTYANKWKVIDGSAIISDGEKTEQVKVDDVIDTANLTKISPTSNLTFKAVYANPVPYYTVTYVDGTNTFTDRALKDSAMPKWTTKVMDDNGTPDDPSDDIEKDKLYVPADYEGEGGTYVFQGWFDAKEGGNKVEVETETAKLTGNITLYSQFKFVPDKFLIQFMNHDGTVQLGAREYEKGQNIEALVTTATKAAQGRAADDTYEYVFLGWDKAVPTFCEGYAVTYTALYKPVYRYYEVKWYNSVLVDGKWVADKTTEIVDEKEVEKYLLATTKHTYNSKLNAPSVATTCSVAAPAGQTYVFAGWYYNDAEGNAVKYERGMPITAEMEFYATYTLTDKTYTVTTIVKGSSTKYTVAANNTEFTLSDPVAGYVAPVYEEAEGGNYKIVDGKYVQVEVGEEGTHNRVKESCHDAFEGWYTDAEHTTKYVAEAITADITLYAKFKESDHDLTEEEVEENPTYFTEGTLAKWCECNKEETKTTEKIAKLTDKVAPTGKIYLGGLSWSSTDEQGANATDGDEISIFTNKNTDIIITANDKGDVNALYNPAGLGSGIKVIRAFAFPADTVLTVDNYGAAQAVATDIYVDNTTAQNENATFAVKLGDIFVADLTADGKVQYNEDDPTTPDVNESETVKFKPLEDGEDYIIYYYVNDKATDANGAPATGNQLNRKVRTAKFHYDNTAPVFRVEGKNDSKATPTYCGVATVTGIEEGAVVTVNGVEVTPTEGKYVINYADGVDNVFITATDKSGNTFSKKIKVAEHNWFTTEKAASCGVEGYKKTECLTCGEVKSEDTYNALAHIWSDRQVIPADCVNNGKVVVTCSICGEKVETEFEEGSVTPVIPAEGHEYAKDKNGDVIYTTVTASTCKTAGVGKAVCTVCGEGELTKTLDLDPDNHEKIEVVDQAASCTTDGFYKETCDCGYEKIVETYPAKGHGTLEAGTAEWYVTLAPTCYQAGSQELRCKNCSNAIEVDGAVVTEEIAPTGEHVKIVANPDTYKTEKEVKYRCATEGCTHKYESKPYVDTSLKEYTVTFKAEDDTVIATFTQLEGTGIKKDAVTAPEKAATTTEKYSFAGWADKDGKIYKLPLTVEGNLELKATYKATPVYYAHQFVIPTYENGEFNNDKTTEYRALLGAIGDERVPSGTPVVPRDGDTVFTFEGWIRKGESEIVTDFTIGIEEGDITADKTFVAKFSSKTLSYEVIFYNGIDYVWNTSVKSGEKVTPVIDVTPTKAFDSKYHYEFNNTWLTEDGKVFDFANTPIKGKTRLYAGYDKIEHTLEASTEHDAYVAATCTTGGVNVKVCSCGYYETTKTNANGHALYEETNNEGVVCQKCHNCDYIEEGEAQRYTVKFTDGKAVIKLEKVVAGNKLPADLAIETPTKDADDKYTYAFNNTWICNGVEYSLEDILAMEITSDMTFEADYDETLRYYNVSYLDADNKPLVTETVAYGEKLYACTKADPTKDSTELEHFTFTGWDKKAGEYEITGDTVVRPVFKAEKHNWVEIGTTNATCEEAGGTKNQCSVCKFETTANASNKPALGHTDLDANGNKVAHTIVLPTNTVEGSDTYKCTRCGKDISGPVASTTIKITVKDKHGNLATDGSAIVTITSKLDSTYVQQDGTGLDGTVTFRVPVGHEWIVGITGSAELPQGGYGFELGKGQTEYEAAPEVEAPEDDHCSCSCHKTSFWGIIYRLFQKFIAIFRGEIRCCADPDPMYNK